ncbi:MAG: hypothetical protein LBV79_02875, partial [Candidatus Adiutrix sp.]|nr:hypothetical protein [Candidatus Adiutrix sp.]
MSRSKTPPTTASNTFDSRENAAADAVFPAVETLDLAAFMALVKEAGRFLAAFTPPEHFRPEAAARPRPLDQDMVRALGAASLDDFFALALDGRPKDSPKRGGQVEKYFPQGPESIRPAISALEGEA